MSEITVIYHRADFDGIFCREIAKKFLGDKAEYIGWDYGDPLIPKPIGTVYVLDLSPDCLDGVLDEHVIWIDHHKSAIEKYQQTPINGYRIDGVAACRLAWQWFVMVDGNTSYGDVGNSIRAAGVLPQIHDFKNREVNEPIAVRLAGEYDIWDKRDPNADVFQFGLRSDNLNSDQWYQLLDNNVTDELDGTGMEQTGSELITSHLLQNGKLLQRYQQSNDESVTKHKSFLAEWEGLKFLCLNTARFNSLTFAAKDIPETGHDALLGFSFDGKKWTCSLYHANHRKDLDLSQIAVKYGGGGHRGACGFQVKELPFIQ